MELGTWYSCIDEGRWTTVLASTLRKQSSGLPPPQPLALRRQVFHVTMWLSDCGTPRAKWGGLCLSQILLYVPNRLYFVFSEENISTEKNEISHSPLQVCLICELHAPQNSYKRQRG